MCVCTSPSPSLCCPPADFRDPSVRLSTLSSLINECEHEITLLMLQAQQAGGYTTSSVAKVSSALDKYVASL